MIRIRPLGPTDAPHVLRINAASRPAVAALDEKEIARLLVPRNPHLVALNGDALEQAATGQGAYVLCCEINKDPPNPESMAFHTKMRFDIVGALATRDGRRVELRQKLLRR